MLRKSIPLILLSFMVLSSAGTLSEQEAIFEQAAPHDLSDEISALSVIWAGDLEGDGVPEILAGGIQYGAGISKGVLMMIRRNEPSVFARIPSQSRTLQLTVCNATEEEGSEVVAGSQGLYVYSRTGLLLKEKSTADVTALLAVDFDKKGTDEIIYGTSTGDVAYLIDFEEGYKFPVAGTVKFIFLRGEDSYYVVTSNSIHCMDTEGEQLWLHTPKGEIHSAVAYDGNNDGKEELFYISGTSIYSLSFDGQKETLILSPAARPLSLLVEDVTADGKPDLILANSNDGVIIYSNLKIEVESFFIKREENESPVLYAADVIKDGKLDLIYGGATQVIIFKNIIPSQELITRGKVLFTEGERFLTDREYERARAKFEEAEKVFLLAGEENMAAQCQEYIERVNQTIQQVTTADAAFERGKELFNQGEYKDARTQFETAHREYALLAEDDPYYETALKDAQSFINECDLATAAQHYDEGEKLLEEKKYSEAIEEFQRARTIYSQLEDGRAQSCTEKIQEINRILEEQEEKEKWNLLIPGGVVLVLLVALVIFLATRKKVSAKLEKGHVYLLMESQPKKSLQLVKEYGRLGYDGLVITRLSPDQVQKKLKKQKILHLSSAAKEDSIPPDNVVNILLRMREFMTSRKESILLLDGLDYVAIQNTFEDALSLIRKLAESVTLYKGILLVSLNPKSLEEKELVLLGEEMEPLEL
ncbi:MAG: DUF835 domain-containing protein [Theionarchaea archaeon]|nr:DUF835 domain-containing protein [Theionarchaea archaeon]